LGSKNADYDDRDWNAEELPALAARAFDDADHVGTFNMGN
jgi:hypothetical protein